MSFTIKVQSLLPLVLSQNTSGDRIVIPAVPDKKIALYKWAFTVAGAVSLTWKTGVTARSGAMPFLAGGAEVRDMSIDGEPWYQTAVNEDLILNLSAGVLVAGTLYYALLG